MEKRIIRKKLKALIYGHIKACIETETNILNDIVELKVQMQAVTQNIESLSENIRNINAIIPVTQNIESLSENIRNINAIIPAKTDAMSEDMEMLATNLRNLNKKTEYFESTIDRMNRKVQKLGSGEHKAVVSAATENTVSQTAVVSSPTDDSYTAIDYFDFENHFRGSREEIKQRQKQYLSYFKDCKNVVDLGCGRGEFLELLKENAIPAIGVDFYEEYADYCNEAGFTAVYDDAIHYLHEQIKPVDGIFVGQVIEHLTVNQIVDLCNLSYEKLEEGSVAIFETPNPTSLATYTHAFYLDPSHTKPVHPLTMQYFLEKAGFKQIEILYTENSKIDVHIPTIRTEENQEEFNQAMQEVERLLFGSQDYAIIARK